MHISFYFCTTILHQWMPRGKSASTCNWCCNTFILIMQNSNHALRLKCSRITLFCLPPGHFVRERCSLVQGQQPGLSRVAWIKNLQIPPWICILFLCCGAVVWVGRTELGSLCVEHYSCRSLRRFGKEENFPCSFCSLLWRASSTGIISPTHLNFLFCCLFMLTAYRDTTALF